MTKTKRTYPVMCGMYILPQSVKRDGTRSKGNTMLLAMFDNPRRLSVVCMSQNKGHKRADGRTCWHIDEYFARLKPWWQARCYARAPGETTDDGGEKVRWEPA